MKVLSVKQPWAELIVCGLKDIENRTWRTKYRGPVLIHASKQIDYDAMSKLAHLIDESKLGTYVETGGIIGQVDIVDVVESHGSVWFEGPIGFVLANARRVPYTPIRGKLGLFEYDLEANHNG